MPDRAGVTKEALLERNARLAVRLGQIAMREHRRHDPRGSLAACRDADCQRTWRILDRNGPDGEPSTT